jgi:hypothetical protein
VVTDDLVVDSVALVAVVLRVVTGALVVGSVALVVVLRVVTGALVV